MSTVRWYKEIEVVDQVSRCRQIINTPHPHTLDTEVAIRVLMVVVKAAVWSMLVIRQFKESCLVSLDYLLIIKSHSHEADCRR